MFQFRPFQVKGINDVALLAGRGTRKIIFQAPTGAGKCLGKDTPVMLFSGHIIPVNEIVPGDTLMGDDSTGRTVLSITTGKEMLYRITPTKGDPYVVNESHILSLKLTGNKGVTKGYKPGDVVDMSVQDYLQQTKTFKHCAKGYRVPVLFKAQKLEMPPYMFGVWLGDGNSRKFQVATTDKEVVGEIRRYAKSIGCRVRDEIIKDKCPVYHVCELTRGGRKGGGNKALTFLQKNNLILNKHIPHKYKVGARKDRLELLAGLIDTDGSLSHGGYDIISKREVLADDICFVARSLGLAAYKTVCQKTCYNNGVSSTYYRVSISGDTDLIPVRIAYKKAPPRKQKKNVLHVGIKVEPIGVGDYYGFEITGNRRFLLGDFTVTHNTILFCGLVQRFIARYPGRRVIIAVHRDELLNQTVGALKQVAGIEAGMIIAGYTTPVRSVKGIILPCSDTPQVLVGMVETLHNRFKRYINYLGDTGMVIIDECHRGEFNKIYEHFPESLIVGFTATPLSANKRIPMKNLFEDIVSPVTIRELIEQGHLAKNITIGIKNAINRKNLSMKGSDFDEKKMGNVFSTPKHVHNCLEAYEKYSMGQKTVVFNCNVAHSKLVNEAFVDAGYNSRHMDGTEDKAARKEILRWFAETDDAILHNVALYTTGFDEPTIRTVIINRATMSLPLWLQMCLDKKTEILTVTGWQSCANVENGDIVASFNLKTSEIEYGPCTDKVDRKLHPHETMYSLKSPFVDIRVTNKHSLIVRPRTRKNIGEWWLKETHEVAKNKHDYEIPIAGYTNRPDHPSLSDSDLRFIGWFLSDGTKGKKNKQIRIYQSLSQPQEFHDSIVKCIQESGFKFRISRFRRTGLLSRYADMLGYAISYGIPRGTDKHLSGWSRLEPFIDKNISDDLMTISRKQLLVLLETLNLGDGTKRKKTSWTPRSLTITAGNNLMFAERMQILCISNGLKCNISQHHYNGVQPLYNLHIKARDYASIKGVNEVDGNRLIGEGYKDITVWCVSTHNGTLITRRNGKVTIMGNCGRGSRSILGSKDHFQILDLGANVAFHMDWDYPHDWSNYFFNPEKVGAKKGNAPTKLCIKCEAMIHLSTRICPYCQADNSKEPEYDTTKLDLTILTQGVNIEAIIERNQAYAPYRSLHIVKGVLIRNFKQQYKFKTCTQKVRDLLNERFQVLVHDWCLEKEIPYDKKHKWMTRKWLMDELDVCYGKISPQSVSA